MTTPREQEVQARLSQLRDLPALPAVVQEVVASFEDERVSVNQVAGRIAKDQALVARMLRVANSPFYGLVRHVNSIHEAVVVLGFAAVRSLVISAGVVRALPGAGGSLDRQAFWQHGMRCALACRALARHLRRDAESAFTAGLLHDLGELAMDTLWPEEYAPILEQSTTCSPERLVLERERFGLDHAQFGGELARLWNFPVEIQMAILRHLDPDAEPHVPLGDIVFVADRAIRLHEQGADPAAILEALPETVRTRLGLDAELLERVCESAQVAAFYTDMLMS